MLSSFQYILCYGSTLDRLWIQQRFLYFNTSYVTVQLLEGDDFLCVFMISIHPMLRFNDTNWRTAYLTWEFQYILCYGSTLLQVAFKDFLN